LRLEKIWRSGRFVKKIANVFRKWRKEKRDMAMSMFFFALSGALNNLSPYKSRSVINMVIKALNFEIFFGETLIQIIYFRILLTLNCLLSDAEGPWS